MNLNFFSRYNYSLSWEKIPSVLTGLQVSVRLYNDTTLDDFKWGINTNVEKQELYNVEARLLPGTAVEVTLHANYTDSNIPYTAELTAIYKDGETKTRKISGTKRELGMWDIKPIFGSVYFIGNNSLVPTTTTTTTSTTTTTTTKRTTTTSSTTEPPSPVPAPPSSMQKAPKKGYQAESAKKGENSAMQSDQSAETRASTTNSGSRVLFSMWLIGLIVIIT